MSNQNSKQLHETQANLRDQVTIGFGFTSDWLRKWRKFFRPITERRNAKPIKVNANYFRHSSENRSIINFHIDFAGFKYKIKKYYKWSTLCSVYERITSGASVW